MQYLNLDLAVMQKLIYNLFFLLLPKMPKELPVLFFGDHISVYANCAVERVVEVFWLREPDLPLP